MLPTPSHHHPFACLAEWLPAPVREARLASRLLYMGCHATPVWVAYQLYLQQQPQPPPPPPLLPLCLATPLLPGALACRESCLRNDDAAARSS